MRMTKTLHTFFTLVAAAATSVSALATITVTPALDPATVGAEDNSTAYYGALSQAYALPYNSSLTVKFTNTSSKVKNYNNFCVVGSDALLTRDYFVLRADNWENIASASDNIATSGVDADGNPTTAFWSDFPTNMDGASVVSTVSRDESGKVTVTNVSTCTTGYVITSVYTKELSDAIINIRYTVDGSCIKFTESGVVAINCDANDVTCSSLIAYIPTATHYTLSSESLFLQANGTILPRDYATNISEVATNGNFSCDYGDAHLSLNAIISPLIKGFDLDITKETIGSADAAYNTDYSQSFELPVNSELVLKFHNAGSGTNNWDNFILTIKDDEETPNDLVFLRPDNYEIVSQSSKYIVLQSFKSDESVDYWDNFAADMSDADVSVDVARVGCSIIVFIKIESNVSGTVRYLTYYKKVADDGMLNVALTCEKATLSMKSVTPYVAIESIAATVSDDATIKGVKDQTEYDVPADAVTAVTATDFSGTEYALDLADVTIGKATADASTLKATFDVSYGNITIPVVIAYEKPQAIEQTSAKAVVIRGGKGAIEISGTDTYKIYSLVGTPILSTTGLHSGLYIVVTPQRTQRVLVK